MKLPRIRSTYLLSIFFVLFCLLFSLIEIGFLWEKSTARLGVGLWYFMLILLFAFVAIELVFIGKQAIRYKTWLTLFSLPIILFVTLYFYANQPTTLSMEAPQQIACALNSFDSVDQGFFSNCFLGYPIRQYYLPLIPSLFEHSLFNLHFGNYLYMIIGLIIFTAACFRWFNLSNKTSDFKIAFLLHLPLHFHYFNYLNLTFEQAFYPIGIGLALVGTLINLRFDFNFKYLLIFTFLSLILISTYVTALAFLPLIGLALFFLAWKHRHNKNRLLSLAICLCTLLISLLISIYYREDLRFGTNSNNMTTTEVTHAIENIFNFGAGITYTSQFFLIFWLAIFGLALVGKFKLFGYIFLGWTIAVFYMSIATKGYSSNGVDFSLHRTTLIIPIMQGLLLYFRFNFFRRELLWLFTGLIILTGYYYQYDHFQTKSSNKSALLYEVYEFTSTNNKGTESDIIYLLNFDREPYLPISDGMGYFLHGYEFHETSNLCEIEATTTTALVSLGKLNYDDCYQSIKPKIVYEQTQLLSNNDRVYFFKLS